MNKEDILIVVLARHYATGISIARSLGSAGYTVDFVANGSKKDKTGIVQSCRYIRNYSEVVAKKLDEESDGKIVDVLMRYEGQNENKPVLFPADDFTAAIIDNNRSTLEEVFIMPSVAGGGDGSMTACMDKGYQGALAAKAGLPVPKEWVINLQDGVEIPDDVVFPCFCKPTESMLGFKRELVKCENREDLEAHLTSVRNQYSNRAVLIQEFLDIEDEIDLSGVCIDQKIIIPGIIKKTAISQHERGVTMCGKILPCDQLADLMDRIEDMLRMFRYTGMFDMEFNIVNGKIYFNEVNLRCGGPNYAYFASGINLPEIFVKAALGIELQPEEEKIKEFGKSFVYEKVAWEDYINGYITRKELDKYIKEAGITLLCNDDDPEPGNIYIRRAEAKAKKKRKKDFTDKFMPALRNIKGRMKGYPQTKKGNERNPDSQYPRVLVAGRNYGSNLGIARAVGEAGYEVEVLRVFRRNSEKKDPMMQMIPEAYSKYVKAFYMCTSHEKDEYIIQKLKNIADPNRKMLLIPSDDMMAAVIDENYYELSKHYIMQNIHSQQGEIVRLMSKSLQAQLAAEAGVTVLKSSVINTVSGSYEIPEDIVYPCFIKPDVTKDNSKSIMKKCDSWQEVNDHIYAISRNRDRSMLAEEYMEIAKEYSLLGWSDGKKAIGPALFVVEEYGKGVRKGIAVSGRIIPCSQMQELVDSILRLVESISFKGMFDADIIESKDGKRVFIELNLRFGASGCAFKKCRINIPGMYVDYILKQKPIDLEAAVSQTEKIFVNERELLEGYASGTLDKKQIDEMMKKADIYFIKDDKDPKPYRHFKKFYKAASKRRKS